MFPMSDIPDQYLTRVSATNHKVRMERREGGRKDVGLSKNSNNNNESARQHKLQVNYNRRTDWYL